MVPELLPSSWAGHDADVSIPQLCARLYGFSFSIHRYTKLCGVKAKLTAQLRKFSEDDSTAEPASHSLPLTTMGHVVHVAVLLLRR